jgi:hypothetical protein
MGAGLVVHAMILQHKLERDKKVKNKNYSKNKIN